MKGSSAVGQDSLREMRRRPRRRFIALLALLCAGCPEKDPAGAPEQQPAKPLRGTSQTPAPPSGSPNAKAKSQNVPPKIAPPLPPLARLGELTFDVRNSSLWVHSPEIGTSLSVRAHSIERTTIERSTVTIAYEDQLSCVPKKNLQRDIRYFQSRLENTRAFRVYKEGKFAEAAQGFHRALELDEDYGKARTNYISAAARAGDLRAAELAFSAAFKKDPLSTYEKLLSDDDFTPLRPSFRTKNKVVPVLRLVDGDLNDFAGYSKSAGLLAVARKEVSWGAENWTAELHVFDARTRKLVSQHTLVRWHDTTEDGQIKPEKHKELEVRLAHLNEALAASSFRTLPGGMRAEFNQLAPAKGAVEARIEGLGQTIVAENDVLRLMDEGQVLDTFTSTLKGARPDSVYAVPEMSALIYSGAFEVAEGCDSGPETLLEVFATEHLGKK